MAKKVFDTIGPRFADRNGGYSRIVRLGNRQGDGADLAIIELIGTDLESRKAEREGAKEKKAKKADENGKEKGKGKAEKE